jgi:predicted nuclease of predicted toxin-antitoxin system
MIRFIIDEDFDNHILRGLLRRQPSLDIVRVQDVGLASSHDEAILAWAAGEKRVLLTHDVSTMTFYAYQRIRQGQEMVGVILVPQVMPVGEAIEDILIIALVGSIEECKNQILYLPL